MKKRMILALVLVFALLCLACSNDADDGASSSESVSVAETGTDASAESTSSADGTSGETSTESTSSETSTESEASGTTTSAESTSSETSTGTESSATSSDASTSSKPAENSESSKPAESSESSKPAENSKPAESSNTSSGSGNPSQTAHKHSYKTTVVKPTCTEDGYTLHKCSCGDSYKDNEVPATGHDLAPRSYKRMKLPTYTEPPVYARQCYTCEEWVIVEGLTNPTGGPDWEPAMTGTEEDLALVRERFQKLKEEYPNGSAWGQKDKYCGSFRSGDGCSGFAYLVSDRLFGLYWSDRMLPHGFKLEDVRPGDIIRQWDKNHECVVWEVFDDYVTVVEGGNGVGWGRKIYREEVESAQISTRYNPPSK